jgi:hypothetical protein
LTGALKKWLIFSEFAQQTLIRGVGHKQTGAPIQQSKFSLVKLAAKDVNCYCNKVTQIA